MGRKIKALVCLVAAMAAAAGVLLAVPAGFERALEYPTVAALSPATVDGLFTAVLFGLLGVIAVIGARLSRQRLSPGRAPGVSLIAGIALGVVGLGAALILATLAGAAHRGDLAEAATGKIAIGAALLLFQAAVEEVYFRGWLQPVLVSGWGRWPGIAVTALAYALLHIITVAPEPMDLVNLGLAGVCFGLLAERSRGLLLPIGAHFGWDWAAAGLFGTVPNPGVGSFGALINFDLTGPAWWGGSDGGLASSVAGMFPLLAIIAATLAWPRPARARRRATA